MILTCPECGTRYRVNAAQMPADGRLVKCAKCSHVWHQMPEAPLDLFADQEVPPQRPATTGGEPVSEPEPPEPGPDQEAEAPAYDDADVKAAGNGTPELTTTQRPGQIADDRPAGRIVYEEPKKRRLGLKLFLLLLALLVAVVLVVVFMRESVMRQWPQAGPLYDQMDDWLEGMLGVERDSTKRVQTPPPEDTPAYPLKIDGFEADLENLNGFQVLVMRVTLVNPTTQTQQVPPLRAELVDARGNVLEVWTFSASFSELAPGEQQVASANLSRPPLGITSVVVDFAPNVGGSTAPETDQPEN